MPEKIYLVLIMHSSGTRVVSAHHTKDGARDAWDAERLSLIKMYREIATHIPHYSKLVTRLECTDPDKMEPSIHETPIIKEMELLI